MKDYYPIYELRGSILVRWNGYYNNGEVCMAADLVGTLSRIEENPHERKPHYYLWN